VENLNVPIPVPGVPRGFWNRDPAEFRIAASALRANFSAFRFIKSRAPHADVKFCLL
jgi:hypothetical protein